MGKFYLTTTLPYVNAAPHIGFALEIVEADALARYHRLMGEEVFFNTGTDEHGSKIYKKALEEGKDPQAYTDEYAMKFRGLQQLLNLDPELHFIRTTDPHHKSAAREFWKRCAANTDEKGESDIYKARYKVKYCVGCELEKTDSELKDGRCPIHPNLTIEEREEENYFFRFSRYEKPLLDFYAANPDFVVPDFRFKEIKNFVSAGLSDFSISRLKEKMPWGVPVPGDEEHVMYVWFDALINYISTLGWPEDAANFEAFWGAKEKRNGIQIAGKDNLRQQSAMWQAMLMSAGLPNSKQIIIHGFITANGEKMSKSLGNVVDPVEIVAKYGTDALRFWLLHDANPFEDSDFTWEKFKESYNAHLANGLGNLASRVIKMARTNDVHLSSEEIADRKKDRPKIDLKGYDSQSALREIWQLIKYDDLYIDKEKPFTKVKTNPEEAKKNIYFLLSDLHGIASRLEPFLPGASEKIITAIETRSELAPLFPRIS